MPANDINTPRIAVLGFLGVLLLLAIIMLLQVVYYHVEAQQQWQKDVSQPAVELSNVLQEQQARLEAYRWVDQKKKTIAVPIARAMDLVVRDRSGGNEAKGGGK